VEVSKEIHLSPNESYSYSDSDENETQKARKSEVEPSVLGSLGTEKVICGLREHLHGVRNIPFLVDAMEANEVLVLDKVD